MMSTKARNPTAVDRVEGHRANTAPAFAAPATNPWAAAATRRGHRDRIRVSVADGSPTTILIKMQATNREVMFSRNTTTRMLTEAVNSVGRRTRGPPSRGRPGSSSGTTARSSTRRRRPHSRAATRRTCFVWRVLVEPHLTQKDNERYAVVREVLQEPGHAIELYTHQHSGVR